VQPFDEEDSEAADEFGEDGKDGKFGEIAPLAYHRPIESFFIKTTRIVIIPACGVNDLPIVALPDQIG
jgi:hypothetical protein